LDYQIGFVAKKKLNVEERGKKPIFCGRFGRGFYQKLFCQPGAPPGFFMRGARFYEPLKIGPQILSLKK